MDVLDRAARVIADYGAVVRAELPENSVLFDAHAHLGNDIDGMVGDYGQLDGMLTEYGFAGAFVFCLDEPDRVPAFRSANDRTLAAAHRSGGKLVPFTRLDLEDDPIDEAVRCLAPVFALAAERGVPILLHGGRGLPPIADHLAVLMERNPGARLIIAHAGIADMAGLARRFAGVPDVYFDTSVWSAIDLMDLFHQVPPEQIVYASDYPYGRQPNSLLCSVRAARSAGCDDDMLSLILGESALRIFRDEPQAPLTEPCGGGTFAQPLAFARIHQYLAMATPLFWLRQGDVLGALGLAVNASMERNGFPEVSERIHELLATAQELWTASRTLEDETERNRTGRVAFGLVHLADVIAVTTLA